MIASYCTVILPCSPDLSLCRVDEGLRVRVGDFGLARDIYTSHYYRANKEARLPVKWMAPETLNDGISNEKTDMVSRSHDCARPSLKGKK